MVKGKSEPIHVYTVNGVKPPSFRDTTRGLEGVETRTIGRQAELEQMKATFREAVSGRATHLISLVAEAGIGKSRLLFEFGRWLETEESHARLFKGRAGQETTQIPYSLLRGFFSSLCEIQENDRAAIARQKLKRGILQSTGNAESAKLYVPFIGHLIGFDYSTDPHIKGILGDAKQVRDLAFHYAGQLIADMARSQPIIILLEDIHWADSGSLDFFEHLMSQHPDLPLLIVGLMRSTLFEQRPDWGMGQVRAQILNLLPLSDADTHRLVLEILQKVPEVPNVIVDLIVQKAEGSPFYVEELIRVLIDGGVIVRGGEQWSVELDRLSDLKVPATLTGLLQARLDVLESDARETLQQASVVGRVFWTDIVEHMHNPEIPSSEDRAPIAEQLSALRAKELIYQYQESDSRQVVEFIFKNQILQDVTYESVLLRFRPIYHFQAAEGLVEIGGERANEYAGRVGEHFERARAWTKAAEWYARAGRQAQNTYASDSAINFFQKALDFIKTQGGAEQNQLKLEVYQRLGQVLNWQARYTEAIEIYTAMLADAEQIGDLVAQSRALQGLATSHNYQGDNRASLENAIRAETLARSANENLELANALYWQSGARFRLGEAQSALALTEQALAIMTDLDKQNEIARCLTLLAAVHYISGRFNEAESYWEKALKLFQDLGNRQAAMDVLSNLGVLADGRGDYDTAFARYDSAWKISRETGYKDGEIVFLSNRGGELVALGRYEEAISDLREAIGRAGVNGSWIMPQAFNSHAEALAGLGRYDEAFYSARQSLVFAEEDKVPEAIGMAWRTLGVICDKIDNTVQFSDWETHQKCTYDAETCFGRSTKILAEAEIEMDRARTLREWARYELKRGNKETGEKMWQEARDIFAKLGAQMEVERMNELPE
jgi:predicted ATPase